MAVLWLDYDAAERPKLAKLWRACLEQDETARNCPRLMEELALSQKSFQNTHAPTSGGGREWDVELSLRGGLVATMLAHGCFVA